MLQAILGLCALKQRVDRHSVAMPKINILLEPLHNISRFHSRLDLVTIGIALLGHECSEIFRVFPVFALIFSRYA